MNILSIISHNNLYHCTATSGDILGIYGGYTNDIATI